MSLKAGSETGSLVNHLMSRGGAVPEVGIGATILYWTDRVPATIVKVTPKQVHVQMDDAERIDQNGMSESQEYKYTPNKLAKVLIFRLTKRGYRSKEGSGLLVGHRERYYDYSF